MAREKTPKAPKASRASVGATLGKAQTAFSSFSMAQRTIAIIGIAVLFLGSAALISWVSKPQMTPLFTSLSAEDASAIVEQLDSTGVTYELTDGGATILVPKEDVYNARLDAAAAGLPSASTSGYTLLDDMGVTTSEFQQSVTYKRAIEGELARTISAIDGVNNASVQLALPKASVFTEEQQAPTASVFVETGTGKTLSDEQVQAITYLVSSSVEGMEPTGVSVVDAKGQVLSAAGGSTSGNVDKQTSIYEDKTKANVQAMLDRILGIGNATVAVSATMNTESAEVLSETFSSDPNAKPLTENKSTEKYTGSGSGAAGVLGPDNIAVPGGTTGNGEYTSESTETTNAVNKITENRIIPAGGVARQTISVAVNADAEVQIDPAELEAMISAASGFDATRGDEISVQNVPFLAGSAKDAEEALKAAQADADAERMNELIRTGIIAGAIAIPVILALVLFFRRSKVRREIIDVNDAEPVNDNAELISDPVLVPQAKMPAMPAPEAPDIPQTDMEVKRAEITRIAAQDPQKAAQILRGMMDDRNS